MLPAQLALAQSYMLGRGVAQDDAKALTWYRKAAEAGSVAGAAHHRLALSRRARRRARPDAAAALVGQGGRCRRCGGAEQSRLSVRQRRGRGARRREGRGALSQGRASKASCARRSRSRCSTRAGRGVARDEAEAAKWYRQAAVAGNEAAQARLGRCCCGTTARHHGSRRRRAMDPPRGAEAATPEAVAWLDARGGRRNGGGAGPARRSLCGRQGRDGGRRARAQPVCGGGRKGRRVRAAAARTALRQGRRRRAELRAGAQMGQSRRRRGRQPRPRSRATCSPS